MENAGWNLGVGNWKNDKPSLVADCRRGTNWFGWSSYSEVGTLSATLEGDGLATLDFGNCVSGDGEVKVYLNDKVVDSAQKNTPSKTVSFNFQDGDILKLRDEGSSSVIVINGITFMCSSGTASEIWHDDSINIRTKHN